MSVDINRDGTEDVIRTDNGENLPSKFEFKHYSHEEATEQMRQVLDRFNRLFNFYCQNMI